MSWCIRHQEYEDFETAETKSGYRFYCSVSGEYFGPAMKSRLELGAFLLYLWQIYDRHEEDPRSYSNEEMRLALPGFRKLQELWEAEL